MKMMIEAAPGEESGDSYIRAVKLIYDNLQIDFQIRNLPQNWRNIAFHKAAGKRSCGESENFWLGKKSSFFQRINFFLRLFDEIADHSDAVFELREFVVPFFGRRFHFGNEKPFIGKI